MLSWKVIMEDFNSHKIIYYDLFKSGYWEKVAKELKEEKHSVFQAWSDAFRQKLMSQYWSRSEYEVVVTSWPPYIKVDDVQKLQDEIANREKTWGSKPLRVNITPTVARKIDILEQLDANWEVFSKYVWRNI